MGKLRWIAGVAGAAAIALGCADTQTPDAARAAPSLLFADDGMPLGRLSDAVVPHRYALDLRIDPSRERFSGIVDIEVTLARPAREIWMHGSGLAVEEAHLTLADGRRIEASFEQKNDAGSALLTLGQTAPAGRGTLHFIYSAPFAASDFGLFRSQREDRWYAATQFQDTGARMAFPSFDEPGFKVPFEIAVTARTAHAVIANTPETGSEDLGDGWTRRTFATTDPFPTYLIAFIVGPYDVVSGPALPANAIRDHETPLRGVAVAGNGDRLRYALDRTAPMLEYLETYFGSPYPFAKLDLIAMPSSFGGAMENAAAITYDEYILLMDEESPLAQRRVYTYVHAHELAHMWFGDLATPAWWDDIWLNEAFASWLMYKTAQAVWPDGEFDREMLKDALAAMREDSLAAARRIREPVLRDSEIADAFDGITYDKGGGVLAMFEAYVGEDAFRDGVRLFIERFRYKSATSDDFMAAIAEGSGNDEIVPALRSFLDQPGVPLLTAQLQCTAGERPAVHVGQSRYAPLGSTIDTDAQTWRIPACIAYAADGGTERVCAIVSEREQTIPLDAARCPDSILPNAGGAGYYRFALDEAGWSALIADADRYSASEALVLVDSLDAAFRAGAASADDFVAGLVALAQHPEWDVAQAVATRLGAITILDDDQKTAVRPHLATAFRDRYAALADATEDGDILLRNTLTSYMVFTAEDPEIRGEFAALAAERIGAAPRPDWSHVDRNLLATVLGVGVQELDSRFFDLVLNEFLASEDPGFRSAALSALTRTDDPALAARLRDTLRDERFRGLEAFGVLQAQLAREPIRAEAWDWIEANADDVIAMVPEAFRSQNVPTLASVACSTDMAAEVSAFVETHAQALPGYERSLAQAQEAAALCTAFKAAAADDLTAALRRLGSPP